jgi:hypothetical protein
MTFFIPTFYSPRMVATQPLHFSPSAEKPRWVAEALMSAGLPIKFCEPTPLGRETLALSHDVKASGDQRDEDFRVLAITSNKKMTLSDSAVVPESGLRYHPVSVDVSKVCKHGRHVGIDIADSGKRAVCLFLQKDFCLG